MHLFIFLKFSLSYSGLNENITDIVTYFFSSSFAGDGKRESGKFKNKILVFELDHFMKLALKGLKRHHVLVNQIRIFCCCEKELAAVQFKLNEMTIIEYVQKLFDLETKIGEKIGELKTRNHLEKYEKKLRLKELKKIRC